MKPSSPLQGAAYLLKGVRLLTLPGIRPFVLMPLLLSTLLFALGTWYTLRLIQAWSAQINDLLPSWLQWTEWLVIPLFFLTVGAIGFWTFSMVANLLGSPFNALLAQKVEIQLAGRSPAGESPLKAVGLLENLLPPVQSEINKIIYFIKWSIPLLLLFAIPVINIAAPLLWMVFTCWMTAFQYADIPMSNHEWNDKRILAKLREKRLLTLGFGAATLLMTCIPVINFLAMPAAVAGATALWVEEWRD
ncbi:MAG: sulfate transporter CysZ [Magnetococcales bacterium]|nr:sulfate transporter CysZ [Magnetococcales bacterium]